MPLPTQNIFLNILCLLTDDWAVKVRYLIAKLHDSSSNQFYVIMM